MTDHTQPPLPIDLGEPVNLTGRDHPETSHQAAAYVAPLTSKNRRRILAILAEGPTTDADLIRHSGMEPNTARPCRVGLVRLGMVADSGNRIYNDKGLACILWEITSKGRTALAQQQ